MIFITQLIYVLKGKEQVFDEFESIAIPTISKYKGKLLFRIRPTKENFIENNMAQPYEIHLVQFPAVQDFENFKGDEERKRFLHLKEQSIKTSILIQGVQI